MSQDRSGRAVFYDPVHAGSRRAFARPVPGQVAGRAVTLIPHREPGVEENLLPWDYQRIIAAVRQAAGPVMAREVGEVVGVEAKLEPLRSKLVRLVDPGERCRC